MTLMFAVDPIFTLFHYCTSTRNNLVTGSFFCSCMISLLSLLLCCFGRVVFQLRCRTSTLWERWNREMRLIVSLFRFRLSPNHLLRCMLLLLYRSSIFFFFFVTCRYITSASSHNVGFQGRSPVVADATIISTSCYAAMFDRTPS